MNATEWHKCLTQIHHDFLKLIFRSNNHAILIRVIIEFLPDEYVDCLNSVMLQSNGDDYQFTQSQRTHTN